MDKKVKKIHFRSIADFRSRIASLWQSQKADEVYDFSFESEEVQKAFDDLMSNFHTEVQYVQ